MERFFTMVEHHLYLVLLLVEQLKPSLDNVLINNQFINVHSSVQNDISLLLTNVKKFNADPHKDEWSDSKFYFLTFQMCYEKFLKVHSGWIIPVICTTKDPDKLIGMFKLLNDINIRATETFRISLDNYLIEAHRVINQPLMDKFNFNNLIKENSNNIPTDNK